MNQKHLDYFQKNKQSWNQRTEYHINSNFYNLDGFLEGASSLNDIEVGLLGDIHDKTLLHLQCHFGQDSLSLTRMGAKVTGIDLSNQAINAAKKFNKDLNLDARFICCNIYDLPHHLDEQFDIVFTTYGTIGWLPDLDKWAEIVASYLKPGGQFVFVEFHPVIWMFDDPLKKMTYSYFNSGPIIESTTGTYADRDAPIELESVGWNHSLGEVLGSLLSKDLEIKHFQEYDYSPYDCFENTEQIAEGKFQIKHLKGIIPMLYSVKAQKSKNESS